MPHIVGIGTSIHPQNRARLLGIIGEGQTLDVLLRDPNKARVDNYGVPRPRPVIVKDYWYGFKYDLSIFPDAVRDWSDNVAPETNFHIAVPEVGYKVVGALFEITPEQLKKFEELDHIGKVYQWARVAAYDFIDPTKVVATNAYMGTALPRGLNDKKETDELTLDFLRNAMHRLEQLLQMPRLRVEWEGNTFVRHSFSGHYRPVAELSEIYPEVYSFTPSDIDYPQIV